eukprot:COSAG01_NODE_389_length_17708_cov_111.404452_7_plen_96_part_00
MPEVVPLWEVRALNALSERWALGAVLSHTPLHPLAGVVRRPQPLVRQHGVGGGDQLKRFVRAPVPGGSKRLLIESRRVSKPLAFARELRPRRLNN